MTTLQDPTPDEGRAAATFAQEWFKLAKRASLWSAIPIAFLVFSFGDGWTAMRVAQGGYRQTTGTVTALYCGSKSATMEYTYLADKLPYHGKAPNLGCSRYGLGDAAPVYYAVDHPALSVFNRLPDARFHYLLEMAVAVGLLMPPALSLLAVIKRRMN